MIRSFALLAFALALVAHDLYLMPKAFHVKPGQTVTIAFHNGDNFPVSQVAPRVDRMLDAKLHAKSGVRPLANLRPEGNVLLGEAKVEGSGNLIAALRSKPNGIELEASKFLSYLKHEGLTNVIEWREGHAESAKPGKERYSKYVKSILQSGEPSDFYKHVVGFPVEIVPQKNPYTLHPGAKLPVKVLFRGKPAADTQVEMAFQNPAGKIERKAAGRTDSSGNIEIAISTAGIWKLHTVIMERCIEPEAADWESFWSSLTFEIQ